MKQEYNKNPIYRVLYLFIGFYRFVGTGNTDKDTQGCILLGLTKDNNNESVGQSRQACKEFYDLVYGKNLEDIKLEITNELA
ncbi:hypothetical protein KBJ10_09045 [Campylobacter jejuni]|nr:hypothetical protein [Campylobacter jejuni]MCG4217530.1 hypothetical protein [Campylobacter jejuni]